MKKKISVTIAEEMIGKLDNFVSQGTFRNKSHVVEFALNKLIKEQDKSTEGAGE